ncbi:hypothetical protein ES703_56356 [subsurface metagenome]
MRSVIIPVLIYLSSLAITLRVPWDKSEFFSDRLAEYDYYLRAIESGINFSFNFNISLVASSIPTVWLPAQIHLITGCDPIVIFNAIPSLTFALMPVFVYLISRKYLTEGYALLTSLVIMGSYYFTFCHYYGRVNIAWGFLSGFTWAIITGRWKLSVLFAALLSVSHYGTAFLTIFALGSVLIALVVSYLIKRNGNSKKEMAVSAIALSVLVLTSCMWYFVVAERTGNTVRSVIEKSANAALSPDSQVYVPTIKGDETEDEVNTITEEYLEDSNLTNFLKWESRDAVVQSIAGRTWSSMNIPQRMEFVSSWAVVILISAGLVVVIRKRLFTLTHTYLAVVMFIFTLITMAVPFISFAYGVVRVGSTGLIAMAPCFAIPAFAAKSKKIVLPITILTVLVYGLCTSGIMYSLSGIIKWEIWVND